MPPPLARRYLLEHLAGFDDEALRTFLAPGSAGVDPARLGVALQGHPPELASRVAASLGRTQREVFLRALSEPVDEGRVRRARGHVVGRLFWPLLYWNDPDLYEELVEGEDIHPGLLEGLHLEGRVVADIGAGAGRFTLFAARRARCVVAVDAVPALLERLGRHAAALGLDNVEMRRGDFLALPLEDASVDVVVACSSLTSRPPVGGDAALREARRVTRPGGEVVIIWPDDPGWFAERGFEYVSFPGSSTMRFRSVDSAERLCRDFYSEDAARWVRTHRTAEVPFEVLGVPPPSDACILRVADATGDTDRPYGGGHPLPGVEVR